ncbi:hypothetical protein [Cellulomonas edaphi]|uniref:Secreted protein n=1 Tax=Cellulomonas edaphi TaxID=3053468 RepID=A0ABT7S7G2_9CELL|nr:hypothetical protein [Cellulomons edaphi]MDM7831459.1 hypothetical protein [Cellulomons edaphi]
MRLRRRRRMVGEVFAGVGVAASLLVALALGTAHEPPAPAQTPSPAPTLSAPPSPSATPGPTTSATATALPSQAQIDAGLGLPATTPAPSDVWKDVGPGWALGIYRPRWVTGTGDDPVFRSSVVLASPDGTAYHLRELPVDKDVTLAHWEPGATTALVTVAPVHDGFTEAGVRGWLDLRSGRLTREPGAVGEPVDDIAPEISFRGVDHHGDEIWFATYGLTGGGGPVTLVVQKHDGTLVRRVDLDGDVMYLGSSLLDPDGRLLVAPGHDENEATFDVVDLDTGRQTAHPYGVPGQYCQVVGWQSAVELLTRCRTAPWSSTGYESHLTTAADPLYVIRLDGGAPRKIRTLATPDPAVPLWHGLTLADGSVVVGALPLGSHDDGSCEAGLYSLDSVARPTPLGIDHVVAATPVGTLGSRLYAVTRTGCEPTTADTTQLESLDGSTRTALLRPPSPTSGRIEGGLGSWAVAGGPAARAWG